MSVTAFRDLHLADQLLIANVLASEVRPHRIVLPFG
jgi:hypothetical protein